MKKKNSLKLVALGSLALDTIITPAARRSEILGGSVSYAAVAASFFTHCGLLAAAGTDLPNAARRMYQRLGLDQKGLFLFAGKTFRWTGAYAEDMNQRRTICTKQNVFASFVPELPLIYKKSPFLLLANIAPELQLHTLKQMQKPRFVAADTMELWIKTEPKKLAQLISRVDLLLINDSEARMLTGKKNLIQAARGVLKRGPAFVIIKKGEHGSMLVSNHEIFLLPACPVPVTRDPTGAGDAFAGGLMGSLARESRVTATAMRRAMIWGTVLASFTVEAFGLERLAKLNLKTIRARHAEFMDMLR